MKTDIKSIVFTFRLAKAEGKKLRQRAKAEGRTLSNLMQLFVKRFLEEQ